MTQNLVDVDSCGIFFVFNQRFLTNKKLYGKAMVGIFKQHGFVQHDVDF